MVSAMPSPVSQSAESEGFGASAGHRALDQIEALIEAIAAIEHVVIFGFRRRQHGIAWLDDIAAAHLERADAELLASSSIAASTAISVCGRP